jgi:hypothetical protein
VIVVVVCGDCRVDDARLDQFRLGKTLEALFLIAMMLITTVVGAGAGAGAEEKKDSPTAQHLISTITTSIWGC